MHSVAKAQAMPMAYATLIMLPSWVLMWPQAGRTLDYGLDTAKTTKARMARMRLRCCFGLRRERGGRAAVGNHAATVDI